MTQETMQQPQDHRTNDEHADVPSPASSMSMTARELQRRLYCQEEQGYEVPFIAFTWADWLELQVTLMQGLTRFQRAIACKEVCLAGLIVAEMQQVIVELQKETCAWIDPPLRE